MLFLKYTRPVTRENLPALVSSFELLKARIRRRKILSAVLDPLCFLLHTALMILSSVGLFYRLAGPEYAAALDGLPRVKEILRFCFRAVPERLDIRFEWPELLYLGAALLLPPLLCMVLSLLLRLFMSFGRKPALPEDVGPESLEIDVRGLVESSGRSRKANWTLLSGFLSMAVFGAAVVYCLLTVRPTSEDWSIEYLFSYVFIGLVIFSVFQLVATLTDSLLELFCGLDAQWEGQRLLEDLQLCIQGDAAVPSAEIPVLPADPEAGGAEADG